MIGLLCLFLAACSRSHGPMLQEAYLWQRAWNGTVEAAVRTTPKEMGTIVVLGEEIAFQGSQPVVVRPAVRYGVFKECGIRPGLALRINRYNGSFAPDNPVTQKIVEDARTLISAARASGVEPGELQVDFDCPASRLHGYANWLWVLRNATSPIPVRFTALPSWLKERGFSEVVAASDGFVLQVHSVAQPGVGLPEQTLCDPGLARQWVEQAAHFGVFFRVALPTYTSIAAFDEKGAVLGVASEGASPRWPAHAQLHAYRAEAAALAALVKQWREDRPKKMVGIVWYRLPVASDTMNWRWPTLAAVMQGRVPTRHLKMEVSPGQPADIILVNDGEDDFPLPAVVNAEWSDATLEARDALGGYQASPAGNIIHFTASPELALERLPPGARRVIGWIRLSKPEPLHVTFTEK
ncbi:MAG: DUF3142 domain-containing protein [Chthoniobacteraceae bacterium]